VLPSPGRLLAGSGAVIRPFANPQHGQEAESERMIINVEDIEAGMVLTEPVIGRGGQILLGEGTALSQKHAEIFKKRGITLVEVAGEDDPVSVEVDEEDREEARKRYQLRLLDRATHHMDIAVDKLAVEQLAIKLARCRGESS
jgi:hypothetical protein